MQKTATFSSPDFQQLARRYGRVMGALYNERKIRGRVVRVTRGARHLALGVRLANPLNLDAALSLAEPLALACRTRAVIVQRSESSPGLVSYQFELADRYWLSYTRADLSGLGVGFAEGGRQVNFAFDAAQPHSLVAGMPGAGKSTAILSILAALFSTYRPAELGALVVDPHRDYTDLGNAAHLAGPLAHEPDEIRAALAWAARELARRKEANEKAGRWLFVVVDEAKRALGDLANLALVQALAAEGRKYRLSVVVGCQELKEGELPGLLGLLPARWIGQVVNARISAHLSGLPGLEAHRLTGKGDFWHVTGAKAERLQVAQATPADLARLPRVVEVPALEVDPLDDAPPPAFDPEGQRPPGRPPLEVDPRIVASYLHAGPDAISRNAARDQMGLTRGQHELHRDFANEVRAGLDWLAQHSGGVTPQERG